MLVNLSCFVSLFFAISLNFNCLTFLFIFVQFCNFYFCTLGQINWICSLMRNVLLYDHLSGWKTIKFPLIRYIILWIFLKVLYVKIWDLKKCLLSFFAECIKKVQHSHSRHQETTWNLFKINLKGTLRFSDEQPLEGAICMNLRWNSQGHPKNISEYSWFQIKQFTRLLEFMKTPIIQNSLENVFIFPIYHKLYIWFGFNWWQNVNISVPAKNKQTKWYIFFIPRGLWYCKKIAGNSEMREAWTCITITVNSMKCFYYYRSKRKWVFYCTKREWVSTPHNLFECLWQEAP